MEISWSESAALITQIAMGISLAACAGLRAFLPMFVVGIAGRLDYIPLTSFFEWLESWPALTVFGVAVLAELLADKFPVIDNALDVVQSFVKPIAGMILAASVLTELTPLQASVFGIVAGGSAAGTVHLAKAKTRLVSSVATVGTGNPLLSFVEDVLAFVGSLAAMLAPLIALLLLMLLFGAAGWWIFRRVGRRQALGA